MDKKLGGIVAGKNFLVTGVLTDQSIAFHIARLIQEEGGEVGFRNGNGPVM